MATERQIAANRASAAKSTGPRTPQGKRISSQNASLRGLLSSPADLKEVRKPESLRLYNAFAQDLIDEYHPRNPGETALIQTMAFANLRMLLARKTHTAALRREIAQVRRDRPTESPAVRVTRAYGNLAKDSRVARQHRLEAYYDREYDRALAELVRRHGASKAAPRLSARLAVEANTFDLKTEPNFKAAAAPSSEADRIHTTGLPFSPPPALNTLQVEPNRTRAASAE